MSKITQPRWKEMQTDETRQVESALRKAFQQVDAYRYNSASIRVRVIDPGFKGKDVSKRDAMVEKHLKKLPKETQTDIMSLLTIAPDELEHPEKSSRERLLNAEFEDPSDSML
ncbi:MAG: hypothetical protein K2R98_08005 [Gemmataceae bacterium]|nr:hypothetical protein [Gemmataceae bacterium]